MLPPVTMKGSSRRALIGACLSLGLQVAGALTAGAQAAGPMDIVLEDMCTFGSIEADSGGGTPPATEETPSQEAFDDLVAEAKGSMMRAPDAAFAAAEQAFNLAASFPAGTRTVAQATALWLKAEAALRVGRPKEGAEAAEMGLAMIENMGEQKALRASLILARGRLASRMSNVKLAVTSYFQAHDLFVEIGDTRRESLALQSLGSVYRDAESYDKAIEYFRRAAQIYEGDATVRLSIANNVGNILRDTGDYAAARENLATALEIARGMESPVLIGRVLTNLARVELDDGRLDAAEELAAEALEVLGTPGGEQWKRFVYGVKADIALGRGRIAEALSEIEAGFAGVDLDDTDMSFKDLHASASAIYSASRQWRLAFLHQKQFQRLSDEATSLAASSNLALLGARFQFAEQQLNIERLRNEQLESTAKLDEVRARERVQKMVIAAGGLVTLFACITAFAVFSQQRKVAAMNAELKNSISRLSEEIAHREQIEKDLIEARDKAEAADRMKSTFLATMSHELRTPMNGILGFTEVLLAGDLTDEQREQIEIIDQSSGSLLTLINDILDLSQLEAGKFKLRRATFDLRVTVENAVKLLRARAQEKHLSLVVHIDPAVPQRAHGDEDRLRQIILNLVGNAVKFTEQGGVVLQVNPGTHPDTVVFEVEDTGIGIPDEKIGTLFDRFSQIDGSATRQYAGSGLGLAICKELVAAMDGEIGCTSTLGKGSVFRFSIGIGGNVDPAEQQDIEPARFDGAPVVVVVDRLPLRRQTLGRMLEAAGARPLLFSDETDAFTGLRQWSGDRETIAAALITHPGGAEHARQKMERLVSNRLVPEGRCIGFAIVGSGSTDGFAAVIDQPITDTNLRAALARVVTAPSETAPVPAKAPSAMRSGHVVPITGDIVDKRVLIVDDVVANRKLVECVLAQVGVSCVTAENGQAAVELAGAEAFGLILMDVYMPVMGGIEAARRISGGGGPNAATPIYALTASTSADERREALEAGMSGVLTKPFNVEDLRSTVLRILSGGESSAADVAGAGGA